MKILKVGSQVEKRYVKVYIYKRTKLMALTVKFKVLGKSITNFSTVIACRVSGKAQTYNDLYWL